ncbi:unnamed protein product [Rotaria sp. Silwood1]|nr:unnamed protein product [Rotaria sp. Silwood1]CAF4834792.1 unnamed protein product [Rotaria sp. Silwood1]
MSQLIGQCQDELCLKGANPQSKRLYLCSHHCCKLVCRDHLTEHDEYVEKRPQYQNKLKALWSDYMVKFNEDLIREQIQILQITLKNQQNLKKYIENLLTINHFHDSMKNNQEFEIAIAKVQKAIQQENQSEPTHNIQPQVKNNNENDERSIVINDSIHRILGSVIHLDDHDEQHPADYNEAKDQTLSTDGNVCIHVAENNRLDQANCATEESAVTQTESPLNEMTEIENVVALKQDGFQKSESITSLEDTSDLSQSTASELDRQSSEDSCY